MSNPCVKHIAIVFNAPSAHALIDEADVLVEVEAVKHSLVQLGFAVSVFGATVNLLLLKDFLLSQKPDLVFNLTESLDGKERLICAIPLLLDTLNIPYTGSAADPMYLTSCKKIAKEIMLLKGISTAPYAMAQEILVQKSISFDPPYIIKPIDTHGSLGIEEDSICESLECLLVKLSGYSKAALSRIMVEAFIDGREFNISLMGNARSLEIMPPAEILFEDHFTHKHNLVGYKAKWIEDAPEYAGTPRSFDFGSSDAPLLIRVKSLAREAFLAFDLHGYARVDMRVSMAGVPYVLEVNANPCISPEGGFVSATAMGGYDYTATLHKIVEISQW